MVEMAFEVLSKSIWQSITQKQEKNHWKITQAKKTHSHNSDTLTKLHCTQMLHDSVYQWNNIINFT